MDGVRRAQSQAQQIPDGRLSDSSATLWSINKKKHSQKKYKQMKLEKRNQTEINKSKEIDD